MSALRPLCEADLDAVLEVQEDGAVRALSHIFPQDRYPFPREVVRASWLSELADPLTTVYVIVDVEGVVQGFAATRTDELLHFGTAVESWGTGIAREAHDEILDALAAAGIREARLWVFEANGRARRFYKKLGWSQSGRRLTTSYPPHASLLEYRRLLEADPCA